jgi:hypothetical protein
MPICALELEIRSNAVRLARRFCVALACRSLPPPAASRSHALLCRAHASRTHAPLAPVACACARALLARCPPPRWLTAPAPSTRFARLRRRAARGVDNPPAVRLACGAPRGRPPGSLRLCTARGRRFGRPPLAADLAACGMSLSRPPRRRRLRRREQFFFSADRRRERRITVISLCFT